MKSNKGAIAIFALLAMLFFLVFVMIAYNNISSKAKTQVETTGVLVDYYKSETLSDDLYNGIVGGDLILEETRTFIEKQEAEKSENKGKYMAIYGKIYKIN